MHGRDDGWEAEDRPTAAPSTLSDLEDDTPEIGRIAFCDLVPDTAVSTALGSDPEDLVERQPGTRQEVGCAWTAGEVTARAWVFARPVSDALAAQVVRDAARRPGCSVERSSGYGAPAVVQECERGSTLRVRHAGRFGDTWLSCELEGPAAAGVAARAEAWCVALATSLDTSA